MGCGGSKSTSGSNKDQDAPDIDGIEVKETEPGYPAAKPPTTKKKEIFKIQDYRDVDEKAKKASEDDASTYTSLINYLTSDLKTDLKADVQKVRSIFVWLGNQKIFDMTYPGVKDPNTPRGYMKLIKKGKGSYPSFFALLCRASKIPCVVITGYCKDATFEVGDTDLSDHNSVWNAVYVDQSWRIVHPHWAFTGVAGYEPGRWTLIENEGKVTRQKQEKSEGKHIYHRNEFFFLTNPDEFIYMCMAFKKEWQLLPSPWTEDDFVRVPMFSSPYFSSGIRLKSENVGVLKSKEGRVKISFKMLSERSLTYKLLFDEKLSEEKLPKDVQADLCVLQNNEDKIKSFIIRFPVRGIYKMEINNGLCNFRLDCDSVGKNTNPFPTNPAIGFGYNLKAVKAGLTDPTVEKGIVIMDYGAEMKFQFKKEKDLETEVLFKHYKKTGQNLQKYVNVEQDNEKLIVTLTMPDKNVSNNPEYALEINAKQKGSQHKLENVCNYLISCDQKEWAKEADAPGTLTSRETAEMRKIRRRLRAAIDGNDIEELDKAILEFTNAGLEDRNDLTRAREKLSRLRIKKLKGKELADARKRLVKATEGTNIEYLEKAVRNFVRSGLQDQGDLRAAKERLIELHLKRLKETTEKRDLDMLDEAIHDAEESIYSNSIVNSEAMKEARKTQEQLKTLKRFLHKILAMKQETVSEIHSYHRPKILIHDVMKATYIILGERERDLNSWEYVQSLMRRLGQDSLIRRIKEFDLIELSVPSAKRADSLLNQYKLFEVRQHSAGAGTFYVWSNNIIGERNKEND